MNKFKKLIVVVMSMVMALALAVPAFAADEAKTKLKDALASYGVYASGVVDSLSGSQMEQIKNNQASLKALTASTVAAVKADPYNAQAIVSKAVAQYGISNLSVNSISVSFVGNDVNVNAMVSVNGVNVPANATVVMGYKVGSTAAPAVAANPLAVSSASVIKATGDNSAVVVVAAVLAVVAVLGLGFRKNSSISVA